jgi:ABC-2 type transport system ATP-binding protein
LIEVENLSKVYGKFKALDGLNLTIEENEVFGFLGPNGSGKTTTINLLMGMLQPTEGRVSIAGIDVVRHPREIKKICGYLPENVGFYDNMSAKSNLLYFSEFYRMSKNEALSRINELLELVELDTDKKVGEFSKGMKQRLGMAQALLNDPEVIFLDEPTSGLDPQGARLFRKIIREQKKEGKTIFFSSHILSEVRDVCETVGILYRGKLITKRKIDEFSSGYRILVQPEPFDDNLMDLLSEFGEISMSDRMILITSERDCRLEVSKKLFENGYYLKELYIKDIDLEEVYMKAIGLEE